MLIKDNSIVLFQGDSITDAGRNRNIHDNLGGGYPSMIAGLFPVLYPELNVQFLNRGVSGDRVGDLQKRWTRDCVELKPNFVSIMIGVNDTLRNYDSNSYTSPEQFEASYSEILQRTVEETGATILLVEPFLLPVNEQLASWRVDIDPKIQVARKLAREFGATYIPLDGILAQYSVYKPLKFWADDGVHLTREGNYLLAQTWLEAIA
jgi:lysophospholipase L1-like esterase